MVTAPDGWPIWTSPVRPGREHAPPQAGGTPSAAARAHPDLLPALAAWRERGGAVLADLGYEGQREMMLLPIRGKRNGRRAVDTKTYNALQTATRALAERGNTLLKTTFKALRHVSFDPGSIGVITAAALTVLHAEHHRTA